ncbi:hypothetical protein ET495_06200 [Xylanimonas allomyrinae]|uniref:Uncharacterized protein n=1 Tax=Xylanimonas allomyrinae TaxID=2509459 RepID=A0A4P6EJZ9_9MICO|nr:hypothetical protein [Xylanimonas allomyrinae]QAY62904.1 hypothetical protein ET495_06200 [Xylanimonas allomyrinae]
MNYPRHADAPGRRTEGEGFTDQVGAGSLPILPTAPDVDHDTAAVFFRTSFAVLVRGKSVRRHLYFNLPAAERAVRRALARGDRADLVLVRLVPVTATTNHRPPTADVPCEVARDDTGRLVPNVLPEGVAW